MTITTYSKPIEYLAQMTFILYQFHLLHNSLDNNSFKRNVIFAFVVIKVEIVYPCVRHRLLPHTRYEGQNLPKFCYMLLRQFEIYVVYVRRIFMFSIFWYVNIIFLC